MIGAVVGPSPSRNSKNVGKISAIVALDQCVTIEQISDGTGISYGLVQNILK
jgi:hypothetical protein